MFGQDWNGVTIGFVIALALGLWAVFHIAQNEKTSPLGKALWTVIVLFVPYLGFLAWLFFGPRAKRREA